MDPPPTETAGAVSSVTLAVGPSAAFPAFFLLGDRGGVLGFSFGGLLLFGMGSLLPAGAPPLLTSLPRVFPGLTAATLAGFPPPFSSLSGLPSLGAFPPGFRSLLSG